MAEYFNKYYIEFPDSHPVTPALWRVDIMDSQGETPTDPLKLLGAASPLVTERLGTEDEKLAPIVGRQITVSYMYTGDPKEPLPEEFFEANERRYRVEVRKNGELDGVYYVKPDFSQYPDRVPPFQVQLKAIDGFGYLKGTKFNPYQESGLLLYDKISLYDLLMTRSLNKLFDVGTVINVLQSLRPANGTPGSFFLFDTFIHTDIFYDFVEGPKSVYDVLTAICKNFNARIITDQNQIWFLRIQDLKAETYIVETYIDDTTAEMREIPGFIRTAGKDASYDGIPINQSGGFLTLPATKTAEYEVEYRGINRVENFLWTGYNGTDFDDWERRDSATVSRLGSGTLLDPYRAFLNYNPSDEESFFQRMTLNNTNVTIGDIFQIEVKVKFHNVGNVSLVLWAVDDSGFESLKATLDPSGNWSVQPGPIPSEQINFLTISRSGKKQDGSLKLTALPFKRITGAFTIWFGFYNIEEPNTLDGGPLQGVEIFAPKVSLVKIASKGRRVKITNAADFSRVKEVEKFTFIDTGTEGISNSIFVGATKVPVSGGWDNPKAGVTSKDIELHMATGEIDQHQRSPNSWSGEVKSNTISFFNTLQLSHKPGKLYMQTADRYNNRDANHDLTLVELFTEGTAQIQSIEEFDVEDVTE